MEAVNIYSYVKHHTRHQQRWQLMSVQFLQVHYEGSPLPVEDKLENEQILCSDQIIHAKLIWKWLNST